MQNLPIPSADPMPLPGPIWLLKTLLLLTLYLHLIAMNLLLGGSLAAAFYRIRRNSEFARQAARDLGAKLPVIMAYTITLGVAPLLVVQVLYGNFLYTSSILIGLPWIGVIALLIVSYYGFYYVAMHDADRSGTHLVGAIAALIVVCIGFIYSNNMTLMLAPERWAELYRRHASGWSLNFGEPTLIPRYLHMLAGAIAVTGLFLMISGIIRRTSEFGRWLIEQGAALFAGATIVNYLFGLWLLVSLPPNVRAILLGGNVLATALLGVGVVLALAATVHSILAGAGRRPILNACIATATALVTVALMVVVRDYVRNAYLAPNYQIGQLHVTPQTGIIVLFFTLFIAGLATVYYMLSKVVAARPPTVAADQ
ncbi:MAG TPA: hypothetical protein VEC38_08670 [Candidatus Binataceae bacterium]|nr:hypothetical protein [Candidatus Binataceae bacterium]